MGLEDEFKEVTKEWREHCKNNSHHSMTDIYVDCDAFRKIVSLGPGALPLICNELNKEYQMAKKYDEELRTIKQRIFGTDAIELFGEPFFKISEDAEYQNYQARYHEDVIGKPGFKWSYAVQQIVPDFHLLVGEEGSDSAVEKRGGSAVALDVYKVMEQTIKWLDENMHRYAQR